MNLQMCQPHWQLCKEVIKAKGLWHLVSKSQEEAIKRLQIDMESEVPTREYDPLLQLVGMLSENVMALYVFEEDKVQCPVCVIKNKVGEKIMLHFLQSTVNSINRMCVKYHLQG